MLCWLFSHRQCQDQGSKFSFGDIKPPNGRQTLLDGRPDKISTFQQKTMHCFNLFVNHADMLPAVRPFHHYKSLHTWTSDECLSTLGFVSLSELCVSRMNIGSTPSASAFAIPASIAASVSRTLTLYRPSSYSSHLDRGYHTPFGSSSAFSPCCRTHANARRISKNVLYTPART